MAILGDTRQEEKKRLFKNYISNLQVNIGFAAYTHCWEGWKEIDYVPEFNKFYFICEGEGWLKIGNREYYPKPGQLFLMPAGVIQSFSTISSNTYKKYWCHFTAKVGDKNLFDIIKMPDFIDVKDTDKVKRLFCSLISNNNSSDLAASIRVKSVLLEIIACYIENTIIEDMHMAESESVEKLNYILNYIDTHLSENITVVELARILHFHPNYFIKFFRKHLGNSPIHYINKKKMEKAKNMLRVSHTTVTDVAEAVGFKDLFHFSKSFKSYTGFSPTEFKNTREG